MAGEVTNENEFVAVPFQAEISWDELKKDASGLVPCIGIRIIKQVRY